MFREDVVEKEKDPRVVIATEFVKSAFYGIIIHLLNFSMMNATVYSVLPLMLLILLIMLFTRKEWHNNKKRQYAFLIPYVLEYFGICFYFYNRGKLLPVAALCMTAILATWGVICIECFQKNAKHNLIAFLILAVVAGTAYFSLWEYYTVRTKAMAERVTAETTPSVQFGSEVDDFCEELHVVFYSGRRFSFRLSEVAQELAGSGRGCEKFWQEFRGNISDENKKWISTMETEGKNLAINYEKLRDSDKQIDKTNDK